MGLALPDTTASDAYNAHVRDGGTAHQMHGRAVYQDVLKLRIHMSRAHTADHLKSTS